LDYLAANDGLIEQNWLQRQGDSIIKLTAAIKLISSLAIVLLQKHLIAAVMVAHIECAIVLA